MNLIFNLLYCKLAVGSNFVLSSVQTPRARGHFKSTKMNKDSPKYQWYLEWLKNGCDHIELFDWMLTVGIKVVRLKDNLHTCKIG